MITTKEELKRYIQNSSNSDLVDLLSKVDLNSKDLWSFSFAITGSKYHGSINANYSQCLVDIQSEFDSIAKKLRVPKQTIFFEVKEGCSFIQIEDLKEVITNIVGKAFSKMSSKEITLLSIIFILSVAGYFGVELYTKSKENIQLKQLESQTEIQLKQLEVQEKINYQDSIKAIISDSKVGKLIKETTQVNQNITKSIIDHTPIDEVDCLDINSKHYTKSDIASLQNRNLTPSIETESHVIEDYKIQEIKFLNNNTIRLTVKSIKNPKLPAFHLTGSSNDKGYMEPEDIANVVGDSIKSKLKNATIDALIKYADGVPQNGKIISISIENL